MEKELLNICHEQTFKREKRIMELDLAPWVTKKKTQKKLLICWEFLSPIYQGWKKNNKKVKLIMI